MSPKKIVAIITARGGSKGLVGKNIASLNGRPLIAHTIEAAKKSKNIDDIVVTTDDIEIANVASDYNISVIDRPEKLATDSASSYDVVKHALEKLAEKSRVYTYFILLQPTSPLRTEKHIDEALSTFLRAGNYNSCMSVCAVEHHPYKMLEIDENQMLKPFQKVEYLDAPRQKLSKIYRQNGAIYIMRCDDFLNKTTNFYLEPVMPYIMDEQSSIDIDTQSDLDIASIYLSHD